MDEFGDRNHDGYVGHIEYERLNQETGLENQCWKYSWDALLFADGTLSMLPRATCELQGYAYDAKIRCAHLALVVWTIRASPIGWNARRPTLSAASIRSSGCRTDNISRWRLTGMDARSMH